MARVNIGILGISELKWTETQFSSVQSVQLFETPWTAAYQASLSITNSQEFTQTHIH